MLLVFPLPSRLDDLSLGRLFLVFKILLVPSFTDPFPYSRVRGIGTISDRQRGYTDTHSDDKRQEGNE